MSPLLSLFTISFAIAFSAVITPGPVSTTVVSQSARSGWLAGPLISTGHAFLELVLTLAIVWGLSPYLNIPSVQIVIALLGGVLLLWMGVQMITGALQGKTQLPGVDQDQPPHKPWQTISIGAAATASNPFWYAWWVTVAVSYLSAARLNGAAFVAAFYLGHVSADLSWNTFLATMVGGNRHRISNRLYQSIILLCGLFLLYLGLKFIWQGAGLLHIIPA
jgi:threonine/homoserine/homoserine lactone efflux protein